MDSEPCTICAVPWVTVNRPIFSTVGETACLACFSAWLYDDNERVAGSLNHILPVYGMLSCSCHSQPWKTALEPMAGQLSVLVARSVDTRSYTGDNQEVTILIITADVLESEI